MTTDFLKSSLVVRGDLPPLLLIGVDHRSAPLELRERVAYSEDECRALLGRLAAAPPVAEAFLLSTCNRTEVYLLPEREADAYRLGLDAVFNERTPQIEAEGRFYVRRGAEAARHLLAVAGGLESMVLGEPEILGQVRRAAGLAEEARASGQVLARLVRTAVAAGGRVRGETGISSGAVSFGYAVVDLARQIFQRLEDCSVLLLGAGETSRQVARNLLERGARELVVANRSRERSEEFVELFPGCRLVGFDERYRVLGQADVVVASTAAPETILERGALERALPRRRDRPLLVADLGVPRNVDPRVGEIDNVFLQDIDALEKLVAHNLRRRREEVPRAEEILAGELACYSAWYRGLAAEPLIARLQKKAEKIRRLELADARERFPTETHDELERLTRALVRKVLHHPSRKLRALSPGEIDRLELVRELFELDDDKDEG